MYPLRKFQCRTLRFRTLLPVLFGVSELLLPLAGHLQDGRRHTPEDHLRACQHRFHKQDRSWRDSPQLQFPPASHCQRQLRNDRRSEQATYKGEERRELGRIIAVCEHGDGQRTASAVTGELDCFSALKSERDNLVDEARLYACMCQRCKKSDPERRTGGRQGDRK